MSGIVGIINLDGAPVDPGLLDRMTQAMAQRGPDAQRIWIDGNVGFGHAMLRTTSESLGEEQPFTLDGETWITADARVDGRAELIAALTPVAGSRLHNAPDADLILHAYNKWGADCVGHMIGDFAFAIWDGRRKELFCARDHFGVKPFFYSITGNTLVFSNTLNVVRLHPDTPAALNDLAIADFLMFGYNQELDTTAFAGIRSLAPAHRLIQGSGRSRVERYWELPTSDVIHYRQKGDYVEHFRELLTTAVEDRLRTPNVAVSMSGGLDSPAVAAVAHEVLSRRGVPFDLRAHTVTYDPLIPDRERYYAGLVAEKLSIPIHYLAGNPYEPHQGWDLPELRTPEPSPRVLSAMELALHREVATHSRVLLTAHGGDIALAAAQRVDFARVLTSGRPLADLLRWMVSERRIPRLGLRTQLRVKLGRTWRPPYPRWIAGPLEAQLGLRERWETLTAPPTHGRGIRPGAHPGYSLVFWPFRFGTFDPGVTSVPVESRHPFFDLRLASFLLAVPPIPYCINKHLLRAAMIGRLPEEVRRRPKAVLAGDPVLHHLRHGGWDRLSRLEATPRLGHYVDVNMATNILAAGRSPDNWATDLRPLSLDKWLRAAHLA